MFFLRIDDRYIHGQVGVSWAGHLQITDILLANDDLVKDSLACTMQKLSVPRLKVIIKDVKDAAEYLKSQSEHKLNRTLVIVNCPQDVVRIMDYGFDLTHVNIGHSKPSEDKRQIIQYLNVGTQDLIAFQELQKRGVRIEFQLVPDHKVQVVDFMNINL